MTAQDTTLRDALHALGVTISLTVRDWSATPNDAWVYGVLCGWDCEDTHQHDEVTCGGMAALREIAAMHGWTEADIARLRAHRLAVRRALGDRPAARRSVQDIPLEGFGSAEEAARFLAEQSASPRYEGDGWRLLLGDANNVEHAYAAAQRASRARQEGDRALNRLLVARTTLLAEIKAGGGH